MHASDASAPTFEEFYERWLPHIYRFIFTRVQHVELAEDLTAETFLKAQRSWPPRASNELGRKAWLLTIARNVVHDYGRSQRRRPVLSLEQAARDQVLASEQHPVLHEWAALRIAFGQLSERDQELLSLRQAGFSDREIGAAVNLSADAVCVGIRRALKRLQQRLEVQE